MVDNVTGFAYKEHSSAALMAAIQRALKTYRQDPNKIKRIRQTAIQHILKYYTWDIIVDKYLALYKEALALTD